MRKTQFQKQQSMTRDEFAAGGPRQYGGGGAPTATPGRALRGSDGPPWHPDVDLLGNIYPEFPPGWNSATDLMEGFVLAAALEVRARQQMSPQDPWAAGLTERLPNRFRYDTFGSLLRWGPYSDDDWNRGAVSLDPTVNYLHHERKLNAGERIGRLPLLAVVWQFTADVFAETQHLRTRNRTAGFYEALNRFDGVSLGRHGTALFMAAFQRAWLADGPSELSGTEKAFLAAEPLRSGMAVLHPLGASYSDSIWQTAFRMVERQTPDYYVQRLQRRQGVVLDVLTRGSELAVKGHRSVWPGWSA